jgi:hypothetical protein
MREAGTARSQASRIDRPAFSKTPARPPTRTSYERKATAVVLSRLRAFAAGSPKTVVGANGHSTLHGFSRFQSNGSVRIRYVFLRHLPPAHTLVPPHKWNPNTLSPHSSFSTRVQKSGHRSQTLPISVSPPLWSSGQSSWLQIQRSGLDSRRCQIFGEVVGLEQGPFSLVSIEELLGRSRGSGLEHRKCGRRDPSR